MAMKGTGTKKDIKWVGSFRFAHELITLYTWAPSWASAKARLLRQIVKKHNVSYGAVYGIFDGTKDNYTIEKVQD